MFNTYEKIPICVSGTSRPCNESLNAVLTCSRLLGTSSPVNGCNTVCRSGYPLRAWLPGIPRPGPGVPHRGSFATEIPLPVPDFILLRLLDSAFLLPVPELPHSGLTDTGIPLPVTGTPLPDFVAKRLQRVHNTPIRLFIKESDPTTVSCMCVCFGVCMSDRLV